MQLLIMMRRCGQWRSNLRPLVLILTRLGCEPSAIESFMVGRTSRPDHHR